MFIKQLSRSHDLSIVVITSLYIVAANIGFYFAFPLTKAVPFWPAAGLSLAVILIYTPRVWPAIAMGSLVAGALLFNHYNIPLNFDSITALVFFMIIGVFEALFGYFLLKKILNTSNPFLNTGHAFIFIVVILATSFLGAAIIALVFTSAKIFKQISFINILTTYFSAVVVGHLVLTPFILSFKRKIYKTEGKLIWLEYLAFILLAGALTYTLTIDSVADTLEKSLPFLIMPFLLWIAFRASAQFTMLSVVFIAFTSIFYTTNGLGPFVLESEHDSLLMLQIFIGITAIIAFILNTTVYERTQAEKSIRSFNERLEENVQRRTKELNEEIAIRKSTEEKIKVSNQQLRKANTELDNFVYSVSHDLRAPIASVLGLINLAEKEKKIDMMKKYIELIGKSARQQDAFIKDILDISRNARLEVAHDKIAFEELITETFDQFRYYNIEKKLIKNISIDQDFEFHSDKKRLKVILNNLISNSIRYSNGHDPVIDIDIKVNEALAQISVKDNGVGIEKEHLDKIFQMFYRATDDNAGSGLGLYIVKETVDRLRGHVTLNSEKDNGTTVRLELPNLKVTDPVI